MIGLLQVEWLKKILTALYADESILYFNKNASDALFPCNDICVLNIDLNNISHADTNYDGNNPETELFVSEFRLGILSLKDVKLLKKDKWRINANIVASEKMVEFLHVIRREKEIEPIFTN